MTYLGIDCDSKSRKLFVPEKRVLKYVELLQQMLQKSFVSYADVEKMVGKLVSLECAVLPRDQYAAVLHSKIDLTLEKLSKISQKKKYVNTVKRRILHVDKFLA